jgi:signal transduction histidine kinase/ActR/RegA family two-component response regulator
VIGRPISILAAADRPHEMEEILRRIRSGERIEHFETVRRRRDGVDIHVSLTVSPIRNESGEIIGASKISRDITRRIEADQERETLLASERAARADAERANRMKDEFLATVSHEIRTPLNAILGWSQLLRTGKLDESEVEEGLEVIERNGRAQVKLIEDLLDMSRIMSGKMQLDISPVDLRAIIESVLVAVRPAADAKDIAIEAEFGPAIPNLMADGNRLQQVVWNLLSNAIKFTPQNGRVQVRVARIGLQVEIVVSDSGQGIVPEFLPYVFDRFRQADSSSRREHTGLGLGLAIARQLVELHGGSIRAESAGLNQGATFRMTVPLGARGLPAEAVPTNGRHGDDQTAQRSPMLYGLTVLVVDDDMDSRHFVAHILQDSGAAVVEAASAASALEIVVRDHPDVILSDVGMPQQDGYDLIRQVRSLSREAGGKTPAAAVTAMSRSQDRTRALLAGFQTHVAKPIESSELLAVVAALAGRSSD